MSCRYLMERFIWERRSPFFKAALILLFDEAEKLKGILRFNRVRHQRKKPRTGQYQMWTTMRVYFVPKTSLCSFSNAAAAPSFFSAFCVQYWFTTTGLKTPICYIHHFDGYGPDCFTILVLCSTTQRMHEREYSNSFQCVQQQRF